MLRVLLVLILVITTCIVGWYLPYFQALDLFVIVLTVMAGLLVGFAFADGRADKIILESVVAVGFVALALLAMWKFTWFIPLGFVLYGIWCGLHNFSLVGARVPAWFSPLCAGYALLIAISIYWHFFL